MAITAKTNIEKNNINKTIKNYKKNLKRKNKKIQLNQRIQMHGHLYRSTDISTDSSTCKQVQ